MQSTALIPAGSKWTMGLMGNIREVIDDPTICYFNKSWKVTAYAVGAFACSLFNTLIYPMTFVVRAVIPFAACWLDPKPGSYWRCFEDLRDAFKSLLLTAALIGFIIVGVIVPHVYTLIAPNAPAGGESESAAADADEAEEPREGSESIDLSDDDSLSLSDDIQERKRPPSRQGSMGDIDLSQFNVSTGSDLRGGSVRLLSREGKERAGLQRVHSLPNMHISPWVPEENVVREEQELPIAYHIGVLGRNVPIVHTVENKREEQDLREYVQGLEERNQALLYISYQNSENIEDIRALQEQHRNLFVLVQPMTKDFCGQSFGIRKEEFKERFLADLFGEVEGSEGAIPDFYTLPQEIRGDEGQAYIKGAIDEMWQGADRVRRAVEYRGELESLFDLVADTFFSDSNNFTKSQIEAFLKIFYALQRYHLEGKIAREVGDLRGIVSLSEEGDYGEGPNIDVEHILKSYLLKKREDQMPFNEVGQQNGEENQAAQRIISTFRYHPKRVERFKRAFNQNFQLLPSDLRQVSIEKLEGEMTKGKRRAPLRFPEGFGPENLSNPQEFLEPLQNLPDASQVAILQDLIKAEKEVIGTLMGRRFQIFFNKEKMISAATLEAHLKKHYKGTDEKEGVEKIETIFSSIGWNERLFSLAARQVIGDLGEIMGGDLPLLLEFDIEHYTLGGGEYGLRSSSETQAYSCVVNTEKSPLSLEFTANFLLKEGNADASDLAIVRAQITFHPFMDGENTLEWEILPLDTYQNIRRE